MVAGLSQHHVATRTLIYPTRYVGRQSPKDHILYQKQRVSVRWQSTVTKEITTSEEVQHVAHGSEIPVDCLVAAPSFPKPSFKHYQPSTQIDLSLTRPATIESPTPLQRSDYDDGNIPLTDRAKHLFKIGKSYLAFYKTGLKNIWHNSKTYRATTRNLQGHPLNLAAKYGGQTINGKVVPNISRSEYQLSLRTKHDLFKLLPFSLVFLICGEFTPIVIVALGTSVVPYTCRIPQQENQDLTKKLAKDQHYMEDLPTIHPELDAPLEATNWRVEHLEAYRLGLTSFRRPLPVFGPLYHALRTRPKLIRHCDNIVADTLLIHRQGGPFKLSPIDLYEWANSYGLYALRQHIEQCRKEGEDPKSQQLKIKLLPKIEAEFRYMLEGAADWSRLKPGEQWRVGLRTVGSTSPDWKARAREMRNHWKQG